VYLLDLNIFFKDFIFYFVGLFQVVDEGYLVYNTNYNVGFNVYKFVATIFPLIFYYPAKLYINCNARSKFLWNYYFIISGVSMLCSQLPYHDRFMLYAWILIPILAALHIDVCIKLFKRNA